MHHQQSNFATTTDVAIDWMLTFFKVPLLWNKLRSVLRKVYLVLSTPSHFYKNMAVLLIDKHMQIKPRLLLD